MEPPESQEQAERSAQWGVTVELVRRYRGGEQAVLNEIFERYYERVYRIVRIEFSGRFAWLNQRVDTADIVQNTFIKAFEVFDRFEMREPAALVRWLVRIAKNKIRDEADRHGADIRNVARDVPLEPRPGDGRSRLDFAASGLLPEDLAQRQEAMEIVDLCVAELRDDWREVIIRREYEGGSWEYVAESMDRAVGAAQMLHSRARVRLAQLVSQRMQP